MPALLVVTGVSAARVDRAETDAQTAAPIERAAAGVRDVAPLLGRQPRLEAERVIAPVVLPADAGVDAERERCRRSRLARVRGEADVRTAGRFEIDDVVLPRVERVVEADERIDEAADGHVVHRAPARDAGAADDVETPFVLARPRVREHRVERRVEAPARWR